MLEKSDDSSSLFYSTNGFGVTANVLVFVPFLNYNTFSLAVFLLPTEDKDMEMLLSSLKVRDDTSSCCLLPKFA